MLIHATPLGLLGEPSALDERRRAMRNARAREDFAFWAWIEQNYELPPPGKLPHAKHIHAYYESLKEQETTPA